MESLSELLIIEKIAIVYIKCVNNLDYTERGKRGFGSSGISNLNIGLNYATSSKTKGSFSIE